MVKIGPVVFELVECENYCDVMIAKFDNRRLFGMLAF